MFIYLGRRGPIATLAPALLQAALGIPELSPHLMVSRQSEDFGRYERFGSCVVPVNTFESAFGAALAVWRVPLLARKLFTFVKSHNVRAVYSLMPHVWGPLLVPAVHAAGAGYVSMVHDANAHPGDPSALLNGWLLQEARRADEIVTLSNTVTDLLVRGQGFPPAKITTLFHPDLVYGGGTPSSMTAEQPLKLLFFGRILPYKGLGLLVEAFEILRREGAEVELGVYGEGEIGPYRQRLEALGATVVNHWLPDNEVAAVFASHHALVLSHIEASQSGVAAAAFGAGLPVVATPVGGLKEQVQDGRNGVVARGVTAADLCDAINRLAQSPGLYQKLVETVRLGRQARSMDAFARQLTAVTERG